MKPGTRALGIAISDGTRTATVAGAVVRHDRVTDGLAYADCTVGGTDATAAVCDLRSALGREDVQYLFTAGVAPAWFNVLDLDAIHDAVGVPVCAVAFEDSPGLADAIRREFDGSAAERRLGTYRSLPDRHPVSTDHGRLWVHPVGCSAERATELVHAYTPDGQGRPEPLRVARLAARAGRRYRSE